MSTTLILISRDVVFSACFGTLSALDIKSQSAGRGKSDEKPRSFHQKRPRPDSKICSSESRKVKAKFEFTFSSINSRCICLIKDAARSIIVCFLRFCP